MAATLLGAPGGPDGVTVFDEADDGPGPVQLVAVTVNEYAVPLVSPVTVHGEDAQVAVMPPGDEVTVYPVIGAPPFEAGAVKVTLAEPFPAVAVPMVGAPGKVEGVAGGDGAEAGPVPSALVAVTVNVYAVPLVSPVTVHEVAPPVVQLLPPGLAVAR